MSLHKFAEQVASQGRGDDSLLVHMTPDEVQRLQAFAEANGRSLTINPTTGLPEAGFLSDLFKAVAPIALGAFLGPAGLGMSSMMAGVATGGITTLATGSLSRGLMAGLGAYGGAGLGESFMTAGGNAMVAGGAPVGAENLVGGVSSSGATAGSAVSVPPIEQVNPSNFNLAKPDVLSAGAKAAMADPMGFAKQNLGNLAYAAAPIAAGMMVPTTTKMPNPKDTGYIRQMAYNINPDTGMPDPLYGRVEMAPVKASEFGNKTFQGQRDLFYQQNPNPYQLGVGSLNQPPQQQTTPMANGGIVALADGGVPGYAGNQGSLVSDADIFKYFQTPGLSDSKIAQDMATFGVSAADIARATGTQGQQADYERRFVNTLIAPTTDSSEFLKATGAVGLQGQGLTTAMQNAGLSQGAQYALTQPAMSDAGFTGGIIDAGTGKPVELYNQIGYTAGALPGDQAGLEGLYGNINYVTSGLQNLINTGKMSVADAQNAAIAELTRTKVSMGDVEAATGKKFGDLFKSKTTTETKLNCPAGYRPNAAGTACELIPIVNPPPDPFVNVTPTGFYGNNTGNPLTSTPGDITRNPDGTVTVQPNIPGRPTGGFTGMGQVKDAYTAGGGSLGFTRPVPKTAAEHNALYNKLTDDSLDAYNFLMGKGKNLTQRKPIADRPVMQRYDEAVLGRKITRPTAKTTGTTTTKSVVGVPGNPQSYFDEAAYLAANPSVAEELRTGKSVSGQPTQFTSGYQHYLMYGKAEGRPFTGDYQGYTTALALADAAQQGGGGPGNDGGGGVGGTGGGGSGGNAAGAAAAAGGGNAAPGTGNSAAVGDAASAAAAAAGVGVGDSAASGGKRGGQVSGYAMGGGLGSLGSYSDGGRLLRGPGDGVSDSIPATIGRKNQPARLADGEFVIPARIVSELGNGSTDAGAKKLYAMMARVQRARGKTTGKNKVAANSRSDKYLPA